MNRVVNGLALLSIVAAFAACGPAAETTAPAGRAGKGGAGEVGAPAMTIYRSPTCSCCKEYEAYLTAEGFRVNVIEVADVTPKKVELGIPEPVWSCHSAKFGDYLVEGHVPVEALNKLVSERPAVKGLALPGMPAGAPGMGSEKQGPLHVVSFDDGGAVAHYIEL